MIYLIFSEWAQMTHGMSPVIAFNNSIDYVKIQTRFYADNIFEFVNGKTLYYKDRSGKYYQYTEDEIIMFKLKNG